MSRALAYAAHIMLLRSELTATQKETSPLHLASYNGKPKTVKLLLEYGADINTKNKDELTPLHLALLGLYEIYEDIKYNYNKKADLKLKKKEHLEVVKLLIEKGANVETRGIDGTTPLKIASAKGDESMKLLIENTIKQKRQSSQKFQERLEKVESLEKLQSLEKTRELRESKKTPGKKKKKKKLRNH